MRIESLYIASFGNLEDFRLELGERLNIIEGRNESGKSTVADFIKFIFYGFSGKAEREKHVSFSRGCAEGNIVISLDGVRYRVERRLSGGKEAYGVYNISDGSKCFEGRVPGEVFFGIPEELYLSTIYVDQADRGRINGKSVFEAIDNLLFSGDENVNVKKTLKKLDAARTELLYKNKKGGAIFELDEKLSLLRAELLSASDNHREILALESRNAELKAALSSHRKNLEIYRKRLADFEKLELRKRRERLSALENSNNDKINEIRAFREKNTRNGFFPDEEYFDRIKECTEVAARCDRNVKDAESKLAAFDREVTKSRSEKEEASRRDEKKRRELTAKRTGALALGIILCLLFIPSGAASALTFIAGKTVLGIISVSIAVLLIVGMSGCFISSARISGRIRELDLNTATKDDFYRMRLDEIGTELEEAKSEYRKYRNMLEELCGKWGSPVSVKTLGDIKAVLEEEKHLLSEAEKVRYAYVHLKTEMEISSSYDVEDDGEEIILPENYDPKESKKRFDFLSIQERNAEEGIHKNEIRLAELRALADSPSAISERIAELEGERDRLVRKYDAYMLAAEAIETAGEKMRNEISPRLSSDAGAIMGAVTDEKYSQLGLDSELSMSFMAESGVGGRITKGEEYMSAGTSDLAYISLRLAIARLVCKEGIPPIIFDESFSRLDSGRLENMLDLLSSSGMQILLFTSLEREGEILRAQNKAGYRCLKM